MSPTRIKCWNNWVCGEHSHSNHSRLDLGRLCFSSPSWGFFTAAGVILTNWEYFLFLNIHVMPIICECCTAFIRITLNLQYYSMWFHKSFMLTLDFLIQWTRHISSKHSEVYRIYNYSIYWWMFMFGDLESLFPRQCMQFYNVLILPKFSDLSLHIVA